MGGAGLPDATTLAVALRRREVSSRELLELHLGRIEALDAPLNAVVTLDVEGARAAAAAADEAIAAGGQGALLGLPVTIKDALEVAGVRSTGGASELADHVPERDAPVVGRLRAAGAVIVGKTNVPRWSGDIQTYNDIFGTTSNPWDLSRTPGGSSGGPAVAVATGMTAFEIGTDIGGSIRTPSGWTGVCGHKPSYGIVSQRGYLDHVGGGTTDADINVLGPIARSVADLALVLDVIAGASDEQVPGWSLALPGPTWSGPDLAGLRVAAWFDDPAAPVDAEVGALLTGVADALSDAGATVVAAAPGFAMAEAVEVFNGLLTAAVSVGFPDEGGFADAVSGSHRAWLRLAERRVALRRAWARLFTDHDVVLAPVMPMVAPHHDHDGDILSRTVEINGVATPHVSTLAWNGVVGVSYLPSTVVPAGWTPAGLPVGIQVVGPYLGDRTTLAVASAIEGLLGGWRPPDGLRS